MRRRTDRTCQPVCTPPIPCFIVVSEETSSGVNLITQILPDTWATEDWDHFGDSWCLQLHFEEDFHPHNSTHNNLSSWCVISTWPEILTTSGWRAAPSAPSPHLYSKRASVAPGHAILGHFDQHHHGTEVVSTVLWLYPTHTYSTGLCYE